MNRFFGLLLVLFLAACQEEITPIVPPNDRDTGTPTLPTEPVDGKYSNCLSVLSESTLDVVTWNIENFPLDGANTLTLLEDMISTMDADIIALQEIKSATNFNLLVESLQDYEGVITASGDQRLGYLYKPSEIISFATATEIFTGDNCAFPRPALKTTITHVSGEVVTLINVHLKCCDNSTASCGSSIDRRKAAVNTIKNHIDQSLPNASVIVLGDFNEDLTEPEGNGVFNTLKNDATNYMFADMNIATGSTANFSYPSWPSHLDHILITNELFEHLDEVRTIRFNVCESSYFDTVSDHYPVIMRLKDLD